MAKRKSKNRNIQNNNNAAASAANNNATTAGGEASTSALVPPSTGPKKLTKKEKRRLKMKDKIQKLPHANYVHLYPTKKIKLPQNHLCSAEKLMRKLRQRALLKRKANAMEESEFNKYLDSKKLKKVRAQQERVENQGEGGRPKKKQKKCWATSPEMERLEEPPPLPKGKGLQDHQQQAQEHKKMTKRRRKITERQRKKEEALRGKNFRIITQEEDPTLEEGEIIEVEIMDVDKKDGEFEEGEITDMEIDPTPPHPPTTSTAEATPPMTADEKENVHPITVPPPSSDSVETKV